MWLISAPHAADSEGGGASVLCLLSTVLCRLFFRLFPFYTNYDNAPLKLRQGDSLRNQQSHKPCAIMAFGRWATSDGCALSSASTT